jgi:NAD(P)-dependent dehydrogenase (short-subunit alcohol dehydrogenase family)
MDNIRGKTIAITGAARGIGYATAKALLARGARVVIGDRDVALEESAVADLTKLGQVSGHPLDVTDRSPSRRSSTRPAPTAAVTSTS